MLRAALWYGHIRSNCSLCKVHMTATLHDIANLYVAWPGRCDVTAKTTDRSAHDQLC